MGQALVEIRLANRENDPAIMGVFDVSIFPHNMSGFDKSRASISYNAIGEGMILVSDLNGDIEIGDYITTSRVPGYGQKQSDDVLHNYTVAKATQPIRWADEPVDPKLGFKIKLIACTYHGG